jgi:REP element-mobilizing transposase RayT
VARLARSEVFAADEVAVVHVMNRVVRRCFLMGTDEATGKNFDHRKLWIEELLQKLAAQFGIDLIAFAVMSNHFHLVLRSRPDVVATWDDRQVAWRWRMLCPLRKNTDGTAKEPLPEEVNAICSDADKLAEIRSRLSDISWWMRLLCQRIAQRVNREEGQGQGKFWQNRFKAVRLLDEEAVLACAAYVDLNPIRAAVAETLEESKHTSVQRRIEALEELVEEKNGLQSPCSTFSLDNKTGNHPKPDAFLAPLSIDELRNAIGPRPSSSGSRCSEKGFLRMTSAEYIELLDWTARQVLPGKRGVTPDSKPPVCERLTIKPTAWIELVSRFGQLFSLVAGQPHCIDAHRGRLRHTRYRIPHDTRQLLSA